jgi:sugar phosphate isomerase/epimerase
MERLGPIQRLGLSIPYEWWPAGPLLKEIEAAGFTWVQVPAPPPSVLSNPRLEATHSRALRQTLETGGLRPVLHAPSGLRAGAADGHRAFAGLIAYASEAGAGVVVYHAANFPDAPASEDHVLAETRSLARLAPLAERLGVTIALENLAPVFPGPDVLSFSPQLLRTICRQIGSPNVGVCLDVGHANVVASLRHADPVELIEPVLDSTVLVHLHDNLGAQREPDSHPELDPVRLDLHLPPGRGLLPWARVAPLLARAQAPLLLEVHPPRPAPARIFAAAKSVLAPQSVPAPA